METYRQARTNQVAMNVLLFARRFVWRCCCSQVAFDATRWSTTEPFRALANLVVPGQEDSVIDLSAVVCKQKLKLLDGCEEMKLEEKGRRLDEGRLYAMPEGNPNPELD